MKTIAILIPSTTKFRDWKQMEDTYLYKYQKLYTQYQVTYYIGYDFDDPIYSKENDLTLSFWDSSRSVNRNTFKNTNQRLGYVV